MFFKILLRFHGNLSEEMIRPSINPIKHYEKLSYIQAALKAKFSTEGYKLIVSRINTIEFKNCDRVLRSAIRNDADGVNDSNDKEQ